MSYKVDLHTHSSLSKDGGITAAQYETALSSKLLDYIAVTDHNSVDFALELRARLGEQIIVGEEIMTSEGEIVGLFLESTIPAGLTTAETISQIKSQNGLVYIPHPFETVRRGLHPVILESLTENIDIIEVCNGRAFVQNRSQQALVWARINHITQAASSDAHGIRGLGKTCVLVNQPVGRSNLLSELSSGTLLTDRPSFRSLLYPKYNRLRKKIRGSK